MDDLPETYLNGLIVFGGIIAAMLIIAFIVKAMQRHGVIPGGVGRGKQIKVVDALTLDAQSRVVVLQRDAVRHLVLLSPNGNLLIESGIVSPYGGRRPQMYQTISDGHPMTASPQDCTDK